MKFDQETVVKHQFWFLLGGYLLVWLVAVLWLWSAAGGMIETAQKNYKDASSAVKTAQGSAVNVATYLPPWKEEYEKINHHKVEIWSAAFGGQAGMYDWPKEWLDKYNGMTDPNVQLETDDKNNYKDKLYPEQVNSLRKYAPLWIDPVEFKDGFDNVFKPMTSSDWKENPTREECWLAQEDLWVKRELFFIIYAALDRLAAMQQMPIDEQKEPLPQGVEGRYRFANQNWEITLHIRKNDQGQFVIGGDSTIKNIHPSHQPQPLTSAKGKGIWFNIAQAPVLTRFEVKGEPVKWGEKQAFLLDNNRKPVDYPPLNGIEWDKEKLKAKPISLSQGFDQTNSPIRRLNAIELKKQDCRTFIWPLQPNHILAALDASADAPDPSKAAATGATPGQTGSQGAGGDMQDRMKSMQQQMQQKQMAGGVTPGGMGTRSAGPKNATANNEIDRDRYLQPASQDKKLNPPSRHLPLAFQLIVEQSHMHDVLLSLANSRLRFQTTQVEFRHEKNYKPQSDSDKKDGDTPGAGQRVFGGAMSGMMYPNRQQQQGQMGQVGQMGQMQQQQRQQQMQQQRQQQQQMRGGYGSMMMNPYQQQNPGVLAPSARGANRGTTSTTPTKTPEAENPPDDNLVEMTVYGIATLYRIPDAPPQPAQSGSPPSSTQPAVQQPSPQTAAPSGSPPPAGKQANEDVKQPKAPPAGKQSDEKGKQPQAPPPAPKKADEKGKQSQSPPPPAKQPNKPSTQPATPPKSGSKR
jgi:hypothetical protein